MDPDGAGYAVEGVEPDPTLFAALAAWCAAADRLIVEARTTRGSLEEAYLELVGAGRNGADGGDDEDDEDDDGGRLVSAEEPAA